MSLGNRSWICFACVATASGGGGGSLSLRCARQTFACFGHPRHTGADSAVCQSLKRKKGTLSDYPFRLVEAAGV